MVPSASKINRVLCFGDSNTWGFDPKDGSRYGEGVRWTSLLASLLGSRFQVIEEGLNGRTTDIQYPTRHFRSALDYLIPCLDSHYPLDYVILNLGVNDMKAEFNRSAADIASSLEELVQIVLGSRLEKPSPGVRLILVAPPRVLEGLGEYGGTFLGAAKKSIEYVELIEKLAAKYPLSFVNLFKQIEPSQIDGVHFSIESHAKMAAIFFETITRARIID